MKGDKMSIDWKYNTAKGLDQIIPRELGGDEYDERNPSQGPLLICRIEY